MRPSLGFQLVRTDSSPGLRESTTGFRRTRGPGFRLTLKKMRSVELIAGPHRHRLEAVDEKSLLDQALEMGIAVSFACRRGDCGQCVGVLEHGRISAIDPARPSQTDANIYLCNSIAVSDLCIRLPYFPELADVPSIRTPAKIHEIKHRSGNVLELVLRLPPTTNFRFLPGQFVRLTNKEKTVRSYSLAGPPDADKLLRFHVREVPNGAFSDYLFRRARAGDLLQLHGPQGHFFLHERHTSAQAVFLATGTGIAPVYAMLAGLSPAARAAMGRIDVYWGNRRADDEYLADELALLAQQLDFGYWPVRSREGAGARHVQDLMSQHHPRLDNASAFACGSVAMIEAVRAHCIGRGLSADRFHADAFTGS